MKEKIVTQTETVIKKYYPRIKVTKKVNVISVKDVAKQSGMHYGYLCQILRGQHPWNLNLDNHEKAYMLMEERCRIIDEAMKDG